MSVSGGGTTETTINGQGSGSTQTMSVSGGGTYETTITGLMPSTTYSIEVAAVNGAGTGDYSKSIYASGTYIFRYLTY